MTQQLTNVPADTEILAKLREAAERLGLDAVVATSPENVSYAAGAVPPSATTVRSRLAACIVPVHGDVELIVVSIEAGVMGAESWADIITAYEEFVDTPALMLARRLTSRGLGDARIGVERTHLSVADYEQLVAALPRAQISAADGLFDEARMVKTQREIAIISEIGAASQRIAAEAFAHAKPGMTERELGKFISERYAEAGGDGLTMLVVASGPRSALPNGAPTDRRLEIGDIVRLDLIGTKQRYCSDVARTAVVGAPTSEQAGTYELLLRVHEQVLAAIRPGVLTSRLHRIYQDALEREGLPAYHFVGHGLGLTLHEEPFLRNDADIALEPGMVLCIEPLTFVEGRFGIQIEDELLVTVDGYQPFTTPEPALPEIRA